MKKLIIPIVLLLVGSGAGIGAGLFLLPPEEDPEGDPPTDVVCLPSPEGTSQIAAAPPPASPVEQSGLEYARLANQFVVPVVTDGQVVALVVLSLSIEVAAGSTDAVFTHEPKLRDAFLQVLFDHANSGGFEGVFTSNANMRTLRSGLRNVAQDILGPAANDVLVVDLVRQDMRS